jgi:CubicO group peptidase (beta-lactamase class C family)
MIKLTTSVAGRRDSSRRAPQSDPQQTEAKPLNLIMLRFMLCLFFSAFAGLSSTLAFENPPPETIDDLRAALLQILEETDTPGMGIALVTRDEVLMAEGLGLADRERQLPVTADTLFRIGSTSKTFTGLAALKLRAEGKLDFNATLASLAPEVEFQNPWEETDPVRIIHLLEHTTGFEDSHFPDLANQDPRPNNLREALAFHPHSRVSRWKPGTRYSYTNIGPAIVAYVIEKVTGQVFEDYVQAHFFDPIGMSTATYFQPEDEDSLTRLFAPDRSTYPYWHISVRPSGAINASANDMARYVQFYLNRGRVEGSTLLNEADIEEMERPGSTLGANEGLRVGYGMFNETVPGEDGFVWVGHGGSVIGGVARMNYLPHDGIGYAVMFNAVGPSFGRTITLLRSYITQKFATKPPLPAEVAIPDDIAEHFDGYYIVTSPRMEMMNFMGRFGMTRRLSFENGSAQLSNVILPGAGDRYVGVTSRLLRREDQPIASLALIEPLDDGRVAIELVQGEALSLRKTSALVALLPPLILVWAVLMVLSCLLFLPIWGIRALLGSVELRGNLGLRLWPLAASATTLWFFGAVLAMFADLEIVYDYSTISPRTVALAAASVLALVVPWVGLLSVSTRLRQAHRGLAWHAVLVLLSTGFLALYLLSFKLIPLLVWT